MTVPDPRAKRPHENHLQWHSRVARMDQEERDRNEPIVPIEAERHGDYVEGFVMHIETRTTAHTKRNRIQSPIAIMHMRGSPRTMAMSG